METVKLEKGWLKRQMVEIQNEAKEWPESLRALTSLNDEIIHKGGIGSVATGQVLKETPRNRPDEKLGN